MVEKEINLVIEKGRGLGNYVCISKEAAMRLNVEDGGMVHMLGKDFPVHVKDELYPFLVQIDPAVMDSLKIKSLNVMLSRSTYKAPPSAPASSPQAAISMNWQSQPPPSPPGQVEVLAPVIPTPPKSLQFPPARVEETPAPASPAEPARWILAPNQVDEHQKLVVDADGNAMYGFDGDGYPLDSRGNSFTAANYYDLWAKSVSTPPVQVPSATKATPVEPTRPTIPAATTIPTTAASPAATTAPSAIPPRSSQIKAAATQRMQTVAPNQVDKYGVQITDAIGNPIFGMDTSGWYAIDSAGDAWKNTKWVEVDVPQQGAGSRFNAVLIIDISRSMLARDLEVSNVEPTVHSIKRAMPSPKIQYFLNQFKEGTNVPRRMGAALATISFLAEKVSQGPGDKVAVIRFADMAETLDFDGAAFMDAEHQETLENTAVGIVEKIGNSYGQATEMGKALYLALELVKLMGEMEVAAGQDRKPVMCVLLTDGYPTDEEYFKTAVDAATKIPNLTLYIIGLGAPDKELLDLMRQAAHDCGGEFIMPADTGQLLSWYADKAANFRPLKRIPPT